MDAAIRHLEAAWVAYAATLPGVSTSEAERSRVALRMALRAGAPTVARAIEARYEPARRRRTLAR